MYKKYEILKLLVSFCRFVFTNSEKRKHLLEKDDGRLLTLVTVHILTPSQESKNTKSSSGIYIGGA
jgi:hypothetical protein